MLRQLIARDHRAASQRQFIGADANGLYAYASSLEVTTSLAVQAGDFVVVCAEWGIGDTTAQPTLDDGGGTEFAASATLDDTSHNRRFQIFYGYAEAASADYAVTLTWPRTVMGQNASVQVHRGGPALQLASGSPVQLLDSYDNTALAVTAFNAAADSLIVVHLGDMGSNSGSIDILNSGTSTPDPNYTLAAASEVVACMTDYYRSLGAALSGETFDIQRHDAGYGYKAYQVAVFEPAAPTFEVTTDLPTTLTVGTAVSATVTVTAKNGATGPVTISETGLPSGLTLGSTTGSGPWTAPITGTPTTNTTYATVLTATGAGSVTGSYSESVTVSAASSGYAPTLSGHSAVNNTARASSLVFPIPAGAAVGDYALILVNRDGTTSPTTPSGWTLLNTQTATADGERASLFGKTLVSGDLGTNVTVALNGTNWACGTISTWTGAGTVTTTANFSNTANPKPVTMTATGLAVTPNTVTIGMFCRDATSIGDDGTQVPGIPTGWTELDSAKDGQGWGNLNTAYLVQSTTGTCPDASAVDANTSGGWITFMVALPPA